MSKCRCKCLQAPMTNNTSKPLDINSTNFLSVHVMEREKRMEGGREGASACVQQIGLAHSSHKALHVCCCSSLIYFTFSDHIPHSHPETHPRPASASAFPVNVVCFQYFCSLLCLLTLKHRDFAFSCIAVFSSRRHASLSCSDK